MGKIGKHSSDMNYRDTRKVKVTRHDFLYGASKNRRARPIFSVVIVSEWINRGYGLNDWKGNRGKLDAR